MQRTSSHQVGLLSTTALQWHYLALLLARHYRMKQWLGEERRRWS